MELSGEEGKWMEGAHSYLSEVWGQDEKISSTNPESALTLEGWEVRTSGATGRTDPLKRKPNTEDLGDQGACSGGDTAFKFPIGKIPV